MKIPPKLSKPEDSDYHGLTLPTYPKRRGSHLDKRIKHKLKALSYEKSLVVATSKKKKQSNGSITVLDNVDLEEYLLSINPLKMYFISETYDFGTELKLKLSHFLGKKNDKFLDSTQFKDSFINGNGSIKLEEICDLRKVSSISDSLFKKRGFWVRKRIIGEPPTARSNAFTFSHDQCLYFFGGFSGVLHSDCYFIDFKV